MSITTILLLIAIGFLAGAFSGLVGLGGGVILIPAQAMKKIFGVIMILIALQIIFQKS